MWPASWGGSRSKPGPSAPLRRGALTDRIALWLGLILAAAILADLALNGGSALLFLLRKFLDLVEWVAFWR